MIPGILGKKIGMTQVFGQDGTRISVTVIEVGPCQVQRVKTVASDGYNSLQLGYGDTKENRVKKPQRSYLNAKKLMPKKFVREIRCSETPEANEGEKITNSIFQIGDFLDITGTSKGKGFQGGMKRCGWSGGQETHGSMSHRAPGSIGASSFPSRVVKGHGMPGRMGGKKTTVQNLAIVDINSDNNTIAVRGAIPGASGTYLIVKYAKKKILTPRKNSDSQIKRENETA
ncbi:MAG: 50S ribosomal protein L3 [Candidatus Omnitrophota bacterium]